MMRPMCPECEAGFELTAQQARVGTLFFCPECGAELEVISESPIEVTYVREDMNEDAWLDDPEAPELWADE